MSNLAVTSVLVIEDDRDTRANLRDILELDDYRVVEAATATEALERHDWSGYLAILLDRSLPDGTARSLLPQLKQLAPEAAVIIVTGHADISGAIEALRQGAIDYLLKPIDPDDLRARLGRVAVQRRLEEARREAERFAHAVLDSIGAHVAVLDRFGTILAVNRAWREFAARNGADEANVAEGANYLQICARATGDDAAIAQDFAAGILDVLAGNDESFELEYPCHGPDRHRWFVGRVTPFHGDDSRKVVVSHMDITARRHAEEAVRQAEQRFRLLVQNSSDIITALAADGTVLYASPSIQAMLGRRAEDRLGTNILFDPIVHPEDMPRKRAFLENALQQPGKLVASEFRLRHANGTWRTIEAIGQNLLSDPSAGAIIANYRDITERKQAEERALQAERLAAIGQMVTSLTHESRNALQRGQANLELLALVVGNHPRAQELIDRQQRALDDLNRLYEEVRNYAAPIRLELSSCELPTLWRLAWEELKHAWASRQATLREEIECSGQLCLLDRHRMNQVFRNLMENSLAACADPLEITLRCTPYELEGRPAVRVAVRDNGPGLTMPQPDRVFEPFFTTKTRGTGLGLAIVKRVVEAHGGRIDLGHQGPGAEFVLTLRTVSA